MFNLEHSISEWRRQMQSDGVKNVNTLNELESHLREDFELRVQSGESEERAFESAVQSLGQAGLLRSEFSKVGGRKLLWLSKLKDFIARPFVPFPAWSTLTPDAQQALAIARQEAPRLNHAFIGTEHVLLGLLASGDETVPSVLKKLGVDCKEVKENIAKWITGFATTEMPSSLPYTRRVLKSLRLAATEAKVSKQAPIGSEHIFLGLLLEGDGVAARVLRGFGVSSKRAREAIARELGGSRCDT